MGAHTYDIVCPNCKNLAEETSESYPFTRIYVICKECGFYAQPSTGFLTLDELNAERNEVNANLDDDNDEDMRLEELDELPPQDESLVL